MAGPYRPTIRSRGGRLQAIGGGYKIEVGRYLGWTVSDWSPPTPGNPATIYVFRDLREDGSKRDYIGVRPDELGLVWRH